MSGDRFSLYRLCECPQCGGDGKVERVSNASSIPPYDYHRLSLMVKCPECRGEGRVRQELATARTPEAVGVAIVQLGREGEWAECAFGLLDREGETNQKWLVLPWLPSARNVRDAARTLARSKGTR